MPSPTSFRAAVRAALSHADGPDMRDVATDAVALLSEDQVFAAAIAHLTSIARQEHNKSHRGVVGATGQTHEVLNVAGQDKYLSDATEEERQWAAQQRETLGAALMRRAGQLRDRTIGAITIGDVRRLRREVDHLRALTNALEAAGRGIETGEVERQIQKQVDDLRRQRVAAWKTGERFRRLTPDANEMGSWATRTRRKARR